MVNQRGLKMCKKSMGIIMFFILSSSVMAENITGQIQVSLTILPAHGCLKELCVINKEQVIKQMDKSNFNNKQEFIVEKKSNEIIVTF